MTNSLDDVSARLQKLLLMLSSNRDGEIISAVHAIERTLRTVGADWHDLASGLLVSEQQPNPACNDDTGAEDWRVLRAFCERRGSFLSAREKDFIDDPKYWRGQLTPKQHAWLAAIHQRLRREAA